MNKVSNVHCYSGHVYAQRPLHFEYCEERYEVSDIRMEWQEPGRRLFLVYSGQKEFKLCYNEAEDLWSVSEISR